MAKHKANKRVADEKPARKAGLTGRQKLFVAEYVKDRNATAAYIRAGYKDTPAARHNAARLMSKDNVKSATEALGQHALKAIVERAAVDTACVLSNLQEVVERCMQRAPVMTAHGDQAVDEEGRHVWRFDAKGAIAALVAIGNHLGMFKQKPAESVGTGLEIVRIEVLAPSPEPVEKLTEVPSDAEACAGCETPKPGGV
jgi:phage terminase small subunit